MTQLNIFKQQVFQLLLSALNTKIASIQASVDALKSSIENETKSSAGDKYETTRAMLHIEQDNVARQMANAYKQRSELLAVEFVGPSSNIIPGSLVLTDMGMFYISIGYGKVVIDNRNVIVLSAISPLGKVFLGLKGDAVFTFNGIRYLIQEIA